MDLSHSPTDLAPSAVTEINIPLSIEAMLVTQAELRRQVSEILIRSQSMLVDNGGVAISLTEMQAAARTILRAAEQALEVLDSRFTVPLARPGISGGAPGGTKAAGAVKKGADILVVDDNSVNRELLARRLELQGYQIHRAENGRFALEQLRARPFDLVLLDIMMPEIDGYEVLRLMKLDEVLRHIPVIMISALGDLDSIVRCIEVGAEDYLPKPFNSTLLVARVDASLEKKRLRDQEQLTYQALVYSQNQLAGELAEAASYVRALIPAPLRNGIQTDWLFIPSTQLGGDSFGYYWLDEDNFVIFLLDVCGHGVGAALLSISVVNVLRSQALSATNFLDPSQVLSGLNEAFPMEKQNDMYFTIWYGVFNRKSRELAYGIGGHPHALLMTGPSEATARVIPMGAPGLLIGGMPGVTYRTHRLTLDSFAKLILFSDGVCEVNSPDGQQWDYDEFMKLLLQPATPEANELAVVLNEGRRISGEQTFDDDFSMVKFLF
jgi:phosphoserine phosphatase RsbU/P